MLAIVLPLPVLTVLAAAVVAAVRRWALRREILDHPNARSSHVAPTPRGGGLGIVLASLLGWAVLPLLGVSLDRALVGILAAALLVAAVSLYEDITQSLAAPVRFGCHLAAAGAAFAAMGMPDLIVLPWLDERALTLWAAPLVLLWLVGMTNAYNFMDGIDGIAGGQAVAAGLAWCVLGALADAPLLAASGGILVATSLGFLVYNWPPAQIFMGDVGSTFLGFTFAALAFASAASDARLPFAGLLVLWPFAFDTAFTLCRRAARRENLLTAHRSHLYQRLVIAGWSHRTVSLLYIGLSLAGAALAVLWQRDLPAADPTITLALPVLAAGLWLTVVVRERQAASNCMK